MYMNRIELWQDWPKTQFHTNWIEYLKNNSPDITIIFPALCSLAWELMARPWRSLWVWFLVLHGDANARETVYQHRRLRLLLSSKFFLLLEICQFYWFFSLFSFVLLLVHVNIAVWKKKYYKVLISFIILL